MHLDYYSHNSQDSHYIYVHYVLTISDIQEVEMKQTVSIADAKKHLSDLLGKVAYGKESITITKRGRPIAEIIPIEKREKPKHIVDVVGKIVAPRDFTQALEKIIADRKKHKPRLLKI